MTQEDKELLLKDLCARLPYGVKVNINGRIEVLDSICDDDGYHFNFIGSNKEGVTIEDVKPYLFPLSSMTEEQKKEEYEICKYYLNGYESKLIDFYNKNHFDYRGLIPKGLANDATGLNIY